ncbi:glutathione hydrolase 5 proenzyme [Gadus macrocephalus]|uniref:glutathione hydrolase 5 proenzyme n=1 Tax=Gadus macrocephalus TaxID=80720 RepID=UPI0028CB5530|nr:glutathione hydrolase 5 proenzyme [Gadus macrocephalus]
MDKMKTWQGRLLGCLGLFFVVILTCLSIAYFTEGCSKGAFKHAAVAADSKLCSDIGRDILHQGGSAVDGAIAALLCTSVINPQSMGLGGGAIFTIRDKSGKVKVYSSRETVPKSFKANLLDDCPTKFTLISGSQWIGVPGELRGYQHVHQLHGRLPWARLFEPTIKLARKGIPVPAYLAKLLSNPLIGNLIRFSSLCQLFCKPDKTILGEGDTLRFPKLADTLETIAAQGADALYNGQIGLDLVQDVKEAGGTLSMEDLRSFKVQVADPWPISLGETRMLIPPPPAGGAVLAFILNVMKGYNLTSNSMKGDQRIQTYHRFVEAAKFANGQKHVIRDPAIKCAKNASYLLDGAFADTIRDLISADCTHNDEYYNTQPLVDRFGTTHVSVLADDGSVVSVTSTINQLFGSAILSPRTGIILNNELADFCGRVASIRAGEQPPSSMAPTILESSSGGGTLAIGGSGGSMITTAVALALMNHLWLGMSLQEAIAAPVVFVDSKNGLQFGPGFDEKVRAGLKALGHRVEDLKYPFNAVNAVARHRGCIAAVSDQRKMGRPSGY